MWSDGIWIRDQIHLTGVMFEVAPEAMSISEYGFEEGIPVLIREFQGCVLRRWGTMEQAWSAAFDIDGSGTVTFSEFSMGCKRSGYVSNAMRIWSLLDVDKDGTISLAELDTDVSRRMSTGWSRQVSPHGPHSTSRGEREPRAPTATLLGLLPVPASPEHAKHGTPSTATPHAPSRFSRCMTTTPSEHDALPVLADQRPKSQGQKGPHVQDRTMPPLTGRANTSHGFRR